MCIGSFLYVYSVPVLCVDGHVDEFISVYYSQIYMLMCRLACGEGWGCTYRPLYTRLYKLLTFQYSQNFISHRITYHPSTISIYDTNSTVKSRRFYTLNKPNNHFQLSEYDLGADPNTEGISKEQVDDIFLGLNTTGSLCLICGNTADYKLVPKHKHLNTAEIQDRGFVCTHCLQAHINPNDYGVRKLR